MSSSAITVSLLDGINVFVVGFVVSLLSQEIAKSSEQVSIGSSNLSLVFIISPICKDNIISPIANIRNKCQISANYICLNHII
jgi:hypothetical protein